jgi:hypothetical protein
MLACVVSGFSGVNVYLLYVALWQCRVSVVCLTEQIKICPSALWCCEMIKDSLFCLYVYIHILGQQELYLMSPDPLHILCSLSDEVGNI